MAGPPCPAAPAALPQRHRGDNTVEGAAMRLKTAKRRQGVPGYALAAMRPLPTGSW